MDGHAIAAVPSGRRWLPWMRDQKAEFDRHTRLLGMSDPPRFFNSGVLLIDIARWNETDLGGRTLDFIRCHADICYLPDEHGLNGVLDGRIAEISPPWNASPRVWREPKLRQAMQPVIIHYSGVDKPWKRFGYGKDMRQNRMVSPFYRSFLADTPWSGWLDEQWTLRDVGKNLLYEWRVATKRLRGKSPVRPTRRQRLQDVEDFRSYCLANRFADVEQGIVVWADGQLRLAANSP
jgi:lipopolysaccharide biosynthesis glycosyltransferase